jgi:hypothetical protein
MLLSLLLSVWQIAGGNPFPHPNHAGVLSRDLAASRFSPEGIPAEKTCGKIGMKTRCSGWYNDQLGIPVNERSNGI